MGENAKQKAEEMMVAMTRESWNDSVGRLEALITACANLGAELAMATNAMPARRTDAVWVAFRQVEALLTPAEAGEEGEK